MLTQITVNPVRFFVSLLGLKTKNTKLPHYLPVVEPPVTGAFPSQIATESLSVSWREWQKKNAQLLLKLSLIHQNPVQEVKTSVNVQEPIKMN